MNGIVNYIRTQEGNRKPGKPAEKTNTDCENQLHQPINNDTGKWNLKTINTFY